MALTKIYVPLTGWFKNLKHQLGRNSTVTEKDAANITEASELVEQLVRRGEHIPYAHFPVGSVEASGFRPVKSHGHHIGWVYEIETQENQFC